MRDDLVAPRSVESQARARCSETQRGRSFDRTRGGSIVIQELGLRHRQRRARLSGDQESAQSRTSRPTRLRRRTAAVRGQCSPPCFQPQRRHTGTSQGRFRPGIRTARVRGSGECGCFGSRGRTATRRWSCASAGAAGHPLQLPEDARTATSEGPMTPRTSMPPMRSIRVDRMST